MDTDYMYFIELSKAAIYDTVPDLPSDSIDWQLIWDTADAQNILGLIASAVLKLPSDYQPKNAEEWQQAMFQTIYVMNMRFCDFERMCKALKHMDVEFICMKGIVVKDYYPIPELRTMGDFDIFIKEQDLTKIEKAFLKNGYTIIKQPLCSTFINEKKTVFEVFCTLQEEFRTDTEIMNRQIVKNAVNWKENAFMMQPTDLFAYNIIHTAKHFVHEGCGIRNIFDAVLTYNKYKAEINIETVRSLCRSQGYEKVFDYIIAAIKKYFGITIDDAVCENVDEFMLYLLKDGVFGDNEKKSIFTAHLIDHDGSRVDGYKRVFFPPKEMLEHKYEYLKKYEWMLQIAWIHRFVLAVFKERRSVIDMSKGLKDSARYAEDREKRLKELGLV